MSAQMLQRTASRRVQNFSHPFVQLLPHPYMGAAFLHIAGRKPNSPVSHRKPGPAAEHGAQRQFRPFADFPLRAGYQLGSRPRPRYSLRTARRPIRYSPAAFPGKKRQVPAGSPSTVSRKCFLLFCHAIAMSPFGKAYRPIKKLFFAASLGII